MLGNFGDREVETPISSSQTWPVSHCWRVTLRSAGEAAAVAHADLRGAEHQEGVGEARRGGAVDLEMADRELARAQLDRGQVLDVDGAVAGQPRAHEQGDVVAPGHERLLEEFELRAAQRHELGEALRVVAAEGEPSLHVDAAEQEGGVDAVVDVALVDVGFQARVGARDQVGIAGGVDHDLGENGVAALLALEDRALDDVAFQDRRGCPGVQQQAHLGLARHLHGDASSALRDRRSATR